MNRECSFLIAVNRETTKLFPVIRERKYARDSLLRRGSKGFFSSGVDPLSNVSAGTEFTGDGGKRGSLCQIPHPRWPPSGGDNFQ